MAIGTALAALVTGCGDSGPGPLPPECSDGPDQVTKALRGAPGEVRVEHTTLLSVCVARATDDAELQQLGYSFTPVADRLREIGTRRAALELGFLVGAVHRGARDSNGIHAELVRRMDRRLAFDEPALQHAADRGVAAGEAHG